MPSKLDKILNYKVLLIVNIVIIIAAGLSGQFFEESGLIHLVAIVFVILGISRIFIHYDAYDRYLKLLIIGGSTALIIFSASHIVEFFGYVYLGIYEDAIFVSVINFYIMSMLAVTVGAEYFLNALKKSSVFVMLALIFGIIIFLGLTVLIFAKIIPVSLEPDQSIPYIYAILVLATSIVSIYRLLEIKKHVSIMAGFVNYFIASFTLITISALQYAFYEIIEIAGIPDYQIIYASHFLFYGAMSLMFLAFTRLANLGGIYKDADEYKLIKNREDKKMNEAELKTVVLEEKVKDLEALNKSMVGREVKMVELKKENEELKKLEKYHDDHS